MGDCKDCSFARERRLAILFLPLLDLPAARSQRALMLFFKELASFAHGHITAGGSRVHGNAILARDRHLTAGTLRDSRDHVRLN